MKKATIKKQLLTKSLIQIKTFKFNTTRLTESHSQFSPVSWILLQQHLPAPEPCDPQSSGGSPA